MQHRGGLYLNTATGRLIFNMYTTKESTAHKTSKIWDHFHHLETDSNTVLSLLTKSALYITSLYNAAANTCNSLHIKIKSS